MPSHHLRRRNFAVHLLKHLVIASLAFLIVAHGVAAAPTSTAESSTPAALVVEELHRILANCCKTEYSHKTEIDEKAGNYAVDCSGLAGYVLKRKLPEHYAKLAGGKKSRPLARDFHDFLAAAPATGPYPSGWQRVPGAIDARPGDVIAWRALEPKPGSTGHVVIVDSVPEATPDGQVRVAIIDSTTAPHAEDTRKPGQSGVGRGVIWFAVDGEGRPTGYRSKSPTGKLIQRPIAVGRPVGFDRTSPEEPKAPGRTP